MSDLDLILRGGLVFDGRGNPAQRIDVGVRNGRIEALGDLEGVPSRHLLPIEGLAVAPGFIDPHSHADIVLMQEPRQAARLMRGRLGQGITTALVGNCGMGVAPRTAASEAVLRGINSWMTPSEVPWPWENLGGFLAELERRRLPLNIGALQAHGPLRIAALGAGQVPASAGSLATMCRQVDEAMHAGAFGVSAGLIYPPGMYADTAELQAIARAVAPHDGVFTFHLRGSSGLLLPSVEEMISIGRDTGCRVHHSHSEAVGRRHWDKIDTVLELEDRARLEGIRLSHDLFPYHAAATLMAALFPPWSLEGGMEGLLARLENPGERQEIRSCLEDTTPIWPPWTKGGWSHNLTRAVGWDSIRVASVPEGQDRGVVGHSLEDLSHQRGTTPFDVLVDLMLRHRGEVGQLVGGITGTEDEDEPMARLLQHPEGALCTDAEDLGRGLPHPAAYGAFPRVLGYWVRERGLLSLPEAIRRMTSLPADRFGIHARGEVRQGYHADLVVFHPDYIADRATYDSPRQRPRGISHVFVNGKLAVEDGKFREECAGQVVRRHRVAA